MCHKNDRICSYKIINLIYYLFMVVSIGFMSTFLSYHYHFKNIEDKGFYFGLIVPLISVGVPIISILVTLIISSYDLMRSFFPFIPHPSIARETWFYKLLICFGSVSLLSCFGGFIFKLLSSYDFLGMLPIYYILMFGLTPSGLCLVLVIFWNVYTICKCGYKYVVKDQDYYYEPTEILMDNPYRESNDLGIYF